MARPDWTFTSSRRYSALATSSFEADGFRITVAPATAWKLLGGTAAQRSSQISTPSATPGSESRVKIRSGLKGTLAPRKRAASAMASRAGENQRSS